MYDVNPLGPMMHLKELERQAAPKLLHLQSRNSFNFAAISTSLLAVQHLRAFLRYGVRREVPRSGQRVHRAS